MPFKIKRTSRRLSAQTISELAIFGAIIIFLVGVIVRQSLNAKYNQNQSIRAMRVALSESFKSGERIDTFTKPANRNVASVIYVEDRKTAEVNRFGTATRIPYIVSASGTFTKNLFRPTTYGNQNELPVMDMFVNGKHFVFTTADFATHGVDTYAYKIVANVPSSDEYDPGCADCFDLDRNGSVDVPPSLRDTFSWQWKEIKATTKNIDVDSGKNVSIDVDGDLKEELVLKLTISGYTPPEDGPGPEPHCPHPPCDDPDEPDIFTAYVQTLDSQEGDIDFSYSSRDKLNGVPRPGLTNEATMYTFNPTTNTYLAAQTFTNFHMSTQNIEQYDVIERQIRLSNVKNPSRICFQPDVEVCGDCFSANNINRTCLDAGAKILYVRSRIKDLRGKAWVTPLTGD